MPERKNLPEQIIPYLGRETTMVRDDLAFAQSLLSKYHLTESGRRDTTKPNSFGRDQLFAASADVVDYIHTMRSTLEASDPTEKQFIPTQWDITNYRTKEQERPSTKRSADLCELFLHFPAVKQASDQLHEEKLRAAFPTFQSQIAEKDPFPLRSYFSDAFELMKDALEEAAQEYPEEDRRNMGTVMHYMDQGYMPRNKYSQLYWFASAGVGTFIQFTQAIVTHAIEKDIDPHQLVEEELATREGAGFQLMRTHGAELNRYVRNFGFTELDHYRKIKYFPPEYKGVCPAIYPMTIETDDKPVTKPIVVAYAHAIVDNIPQDDLTKSNLPVYNT